MVKLALPICVWSCTCFKETLELETKVVIIKHFWTLQVVINKSESRLVFDHVDMCYVSKYMHLGFMSWNEFN